jgi:4-amino-4-deoxy-L-arabinose transferase-like glycosyltransferase
VGGKRKKKSKRRAAARRAPAERNARPGVGQGPADWPSAPARRWIGLGLDLALAALCIAFLAKSAAYAGRAKFFSDECLHAYVVEQIVATGNSPSSLFALYSGMPNNTYPLFHWLGAGFYLLGGRAALPYVNVALCGVMLGLLYWLLRAWASAAAARLALAVVLLYSVVHVCTQVFYIEILSALTFVLAALALTIAASGRDTRGGADWKLYFLAGIASALALLSKQTGCTLIPVIGLCLLYFLAVRRWKHALGMAVVAATFVGAFGVGMFALTHHPFERFRTLYKPVERDLVPKPLRLFRSGAAAPALVHNPAGDLQPAGGGVARPMPDTRKWLKQAFGRTPAGVLKSWLHVIGWFGVLLTLLCLAHLFVGRRPGETAPLMLAMAFLVTGAVRVGTVDDRHFVAYVPVMAAGAGIALADLFGRLRGYRHAVTLGLAAVLIAAAAVAVARVPNYRLRPESSRWRGLFGDAPRPLIEAAEALRDHDPGRATVLAMWTADAWYYSGHAATWGGVNVPKLNSAMFQTDPQRAFGPCVAARIRYFLIDNSQVISDAQYFGLGFTETFFHNVTGMMHAGPMRVVYPEDVARLQQQLLAAGVFDRFLPQGAPPSQQAIWGNPGIPFIVVEFDPSAFKRLLESPRLPESPTETPQP